MYIQRVVFTPAIGKANELQPILEERARQRQAEGVSIGMGRSQFGSAPGFVFNIRHESLAALQAQFERNRTDPAFKAFQERITPLLGAATSASVIEPIVPFQPAATPNRFAQRVVLSPAPGKTAEMRSLVAERIRQRQASGASASLAQTVFAPENALVVVLGFQSLAEIDALRDGQRDNEEWQAYLMKIDSLSARLPAIELLEILVPMQPVAERELAGAATR